MMHAAWQLPLTHVRTTRLALHGFLYFLLTLPRSSLFFFFNDTATTEIYTLSLHDALPICVPRIRHLRVDRPPPRHRPPHAPAGGPCLRRADRKSTRLNSSHGYISYAVFCLKKKKKQQTQRTPRWHACCRTQ